MIQNDRDNNDNEFHVSQSWAGDAWLGWLTQLNCYRYSRRRSYHRRAFGKDASSQRKRSAAAARSLLFGANGRSCRDARAAAPFDRGATGLKMQSHFRLLILSLLKTIKELRRLKRGATAATVRREALRANGDPTDSSGELGAPFITHPHQGLY